ncbi:hypothetical protein RFI_14080 [Reticulomyxa filosa]|uniref:ABC transporter domain-containing protein n=1 Tax=Reticulomyxa filosa TaxID=46433 RepID=X6NBF4_RETFI|nr:hypothetical protein RFI_14080 [Reticulomyxa filosa]|eukprot:ETO23104.1 hypothetical protein RFI_14080 [Reticulomyxa filosa]
MVSLIRLFEPDNIDNWAEKTIEERQELKCRIIIDGIDILNIGLFDLRSRLAIIPQSCVLFSGTLRFNLDPFHHFTDEEVWDALKKVYLYDYIKGTADWKWEQKQFNSANKSSPDKHRNDKTKSQMMGRGTLGNNYIFLDDKKNPAKKLNKLNIFCFILLLDEATSSVDSEMDALIQKSIRTHFQDCTVLTIAHRLNTILDYDRIMVLSQGQIVEFDTPQALVNMHNGVFKKLLHICNSNGIIAKYIFKAKKRDIQRNFNKKNTNMIIN